MITCVQVALYQHGTGLLFLAPASILSAVLYMAISSIDHQRSIVALAMAILAILLMYYFCSAPLATCMLLL
jgi:hypothetical protein